MQTRMNIGRIITSLLMAVCAVFIAVVGMTVLTGCAVETEETTLDIWIDDCLKRVADDPYNRVPLTIRIMAPVELYWITAYQGESEPLIIRSVDDTKHCTHDADVIVCTERLDPGLYDFQSDVDHRYLICVDGWPTITLN